MTIILVILEMPSRLLRCLRVITIRDPGEPFFETTTHYTSGHLHLPPPIMPSSVNVTLLFAQSQSEITHGMSPGATFLDFPDDVILEIAALCGSSLDGVAHLAANVPAFGHIHRRFQGVIGEDFWKNWCRRKGYSIRE